MLNLIKFTTLFMMLALIMGCATSPMKESAGEYLNSSAITAKVKANLVDQLGVNGFNIQVKTYKDDVQLSGFVNSAVIKRRAGVVAANTLGVKHVINHLVVKTN